MIKITNAEASALTTQIIVDLFSDKSRQFPVADAFALSDAIQMIQARTPAYKQQLKKIIESCDGKIDPTGHVKYADPAKANVAQQQIDRLNAIVIEIAAEPVRMGTDWPKLTLAEATILRPLLNGSGSK